MKFIYKSILALCMALLLSVTSIVSAETTINNVNKSSDYCKILFFSRDGCPHCTKEAKFLDELQQKYPDLVIEKLDLTASTSDIHQNSANRQQLQQIGTRLGINISGVPFTLIGEEAYEIGYANDTITGAKIEEKLLQCYQNNNIGGQCSDPISAKQEVSLPFIGTIDLHQLSLPMLTVVLGLLDGFNPCAMWVLLFLIGLLIGMKDRRRMWILGGTFIFTSAAIYFLFLTAWLNFFLLVGVEIWLRLIIAMVALYAGYYNLKQYFSRQEVVCKLEGGDKRRKIFAQLTAITKRDNLLWALSGIVFLAIAVNLVELFCSAGLPAIYTQTLALSHLPTWQYYGYILLYVGFFMFDDIVVFLLAMKTLENTNISHKYTRFSYLVGGLLMLILGFLLIFKPEWLMMG